MSDPTCLPQTIPTILLLGDSLTQTGFEGWVGKLANRYQRRADIINRGCSGYNTDFYQEYIVTPYLLPAAANNNIALVIIFFGANDAALESEDAHHHVPLARYREHLEKLVQMYSSTKVLLLTPPALDHAQRLQYQIDRWGKDNATGVLERTNETTQQYAQACIEVGARCKVPVVDAFTLFTPHTQEYLSDGLHFSPAGHDAIYQAIVEAIAKEWPGLAVTPCPTTGQPNNSSSSCPSLPTMGPYHDQITVNKKV